jgi:hypothetical protein
MIKVFCRLKAKVKWEFVNEYEGIEGALEQVRTLLTTSPRIEVMVERRPVPQP